MPSQRQPAAPYAPFDDAPAAKPADGGGPATVIGLVVVAAVLFVVLSLARTVLAVFEHRVEEAETESTALPAARPPEPADLTVRIEQLRPRGELLETAETVEAGFFSDTVVFTGRVRNAGAGGKLIVRVRAVYEDPEKPAAQGEHIVPILNAASSEPYRIALDVESVKKTNPRFVHEVFVP